MTPRAAFFIFFYFFLYRWKEIVARNHDACDSTSYCAGRERRKQNKYTTESFSNSLKIIEQRVRAKAATKFMLPIAMSCG